MRRQCFSAGAATHDSVHLHVRAVDVNAVLNRLTGMLGRLQVDHFSYSTATGQCLEAVIALRGDTGQVNRAVGKIRRLVGVLEVVVRETQQPMQQ